MNQEIINLYDEYTHKPLTRQEFLSRLAVLAGGTAAALALLPQLDVKDTHAALTSEEGLFTERITYPGSNCTMQGYLARPVMEKPYPTLVIIHENRGLNAHIEDVTRRAAKEGYLAIAPNALSSLGGTPEDTDEARAKFQQLKQEDNLQNFLKAFDYLHGRKDSNGNFGCVGFCWGGAMSLQLAIHQSALKAAVAFYGRQPSPEEVPSIKAAVQLHYAGMDEGVNKGIPAFEAALKKNDIRYELFMYEGVQHAFHNDTAPTRYNSEAAGLAWKRTMAFFDRHLK